MDKKQHWENVYETKSPQEVSWTQEKPQTSLDYIASFNANKNARIIDIGGGDSNLVDHLLALGYKNITVLDISGKALERAKLRLGEISEKVTWIQSDIVDFEPIEEYDIWHDRAAFHFLTEDKTIQKYVYLVSKFVKKNLVIGTFSENGPLKCSGLEISQYSEPKLSSLLQENFQLLKSNHEDHITPFSTTQNFLFCAYSRK